MSTGAYEPERGSPLHPYWDVPQPEGDEWVPFSPEKASLATRQVLAELQGDARVIAQLSGALALALLGRMQALDALAAAQPGVRAFLHLALWQAQQIIPPADEEGKPNR